MFFLILFGVGIGFSHFPFPIFSYINRFLKKVSFPLLWSLLLLFSCYVMSHSFTTPWTIVCQASLSMGFPRQEYWNRLLVPSPEDLSDPGMKPTSPALTGRFLSSLPLGKSCFIFLHLLSCVILHVSNTIYYNKC